MKHTTTRKDLMRRLAAQVKEYDRRGDQVMRTQTAQQWRELATGADARRAPQYLTWHGRGA